MSIIAIILPAVIAEIMYDMIQKCINKAIEFINHINYKLTVRERRSRSQRRWMVSNV